MTNDNIINSKLTTADDIVQNVRIADNNIKFANTLGSFVQNKEFSKGFIKFLKNEKDSSTYIWNALSAIGQDVNSIVYSNVLNYIDTVANIDTCKLKSLKSMMKLVGSSYDIFGNIDILPIEIVQLLDVLSISKKYLLNNDKFKQTLIDDEAPLISTEYGSASSQLKWKYQYLRNAFVLSSDNLPPCLNSIYGKYALVDDFSYSYENDDQTCKINYEDAVNFSNFERIGMQNDTDISGLVCRKYTSGIGWNITKYYQYDDKNTELYSIIDKNGRIQYTFDSSEFEKDVTETKNEKFLQDLDISGYIQYVPEQIDIKTDFVSEDKYTQYIQNIYYTFLSSIVTMHYNTLKDGIAPIYCYLIDEYYKTNAYYENIDTAAGSRRRFKSQNNISFLFDEKRIVDDIDNGTDSLDNYFGAELELLKLEIADRAKTLSFNIVDSTYSTDSSSGTIEKYTRYSYYRKAKVLEYIKFIDNQYYNGNDFLKTSGIYDFDTNYYELEKNSEKDISCHVIDENFKYDKATYKEYDGIDFSIIKAVANNLASLTLYIQKLREKVRLQTRKNYMKGTNNLLRYVINEYLVDFSRNGQLFKDPTLSPYLRKIQSQLSSNNIDNVEVVEYFDTTEYYNVDTEQTPNAQNSNKTNSRYWQNAINRTADGQYTARDGIDIPANEISNFYYNTLQLKNELSNASSNMYEFLNTIFELGANTSYVDKSGMFVTKLSTGQYSDEIYNKYLQLSADYDQLVAYSDGYSFDSTKTAKEQLSDLVDYLMQSLSASYFTGISSNYIAYMPDVQTLFSSIDELSGKYDEVLQQYQPYLEKSKSKYSYEGNNIYTGKYKHDYFIGNTDVYNSTMLLDKISDLRSFVADDNNMHIWEFSDCLQDMNSKYAVVSAAVNDILMLIYSTNMQFEDIRSQYIADELDYIEDTVLKIQDNRRTQLTDSINTSKNVITQQYSSAIEEYEKFADEYAQIEKDYANIIASYRNTYVDSFGSDIFKYVYKTKNKDDDTKVEVTYKTIHIDAIKPADLVEDKCKNAIEWMLQEIIWKDDSDSDSDSDSDIDSDSDSDDYFDDDQTDSDVSEDEDEESSDKDTKEDEQTIKFGIKANIPNSPYILADPGIQVSLQQLIERVEQLKANSAKYEEILSPLNTSVKAAYQSIESEDSYPGDITIEIVTDDADENEETTEESDDAETDEKKKTLADNCKNYANQLKTKQISTMLEIENLKNKLMNDTFFAQCQTILSKVTNAKSQNNVLQSEYQKFLNNDTVSEYLNGYQSDSSFTQDEYNSLQLFSKNKDETAKHDILQQISELYSSYYSIQDKYAELIQTLKATLPRYYYTNTYVEQDLSNVISSLEDDVSYNTDLANIKFNAKLSDMHKSIDSLSTGIAESIDVAGSSVLQLFQDEIQKNNIYDNQQYIAAREMFYQYSGLSAGQAPFFNYKNVTHSTHQLHDFFWNFIEADKYIEIAKSSFDSVYVDQLETELALKNISDFIGKYGQLIDTWKNNVQDYTGYSTRYIDSTHLIPNYIGKFEVADYDGAFYPPAIDMFRKDPKACINSLSAQFSVVDSVNLMLADNEFSEELDAYTAQEFFSTAWISLRGTEYSEYVPDNNLSKVILQFISENSVEGVDGNQQATQWMTSTKTEFAKYVLANVDKTFFERFYHPLSLTKENYEYIAQQLSNEEVQNQILEITKSHDKKDIYDIYKYGFDVYGNIYILYKQYFQENPTYQTKLNTRGKIWIRLNNHPIAIPLIVESDTSMSQIDVSSANRYLQKYVAVSDEPWCYDFNFSDNKKLVCFSCKNETPLLQNYFKDKFKYSWQALAIVSQKQNIDLQRNVLKLHNPDDIPDDIIVQPNMTSLVLPESSDNDTFGYQFIGTYATTSYYIYSVYVKTNYHLGDDNSIETYLDCPPAVVVLRASNETMNIELQEQIAVEFNEEQFVDEHGTNIFEFNNDQAVFSYNLITKQLAFAFLGNIAFDDKNKYNTPLNPDAQLDVYENSNGQALKDPIADEMSSHDMFTDNVILVNAKASAAIQQVGQLKLYNTNADAAYLPLYPGLQLEALIDTLSMNGRSYYSFELLGHSKNIDSWISRANTHTDITLSIDRIIDEKVNGRIYELDINEFPQPTHSEQLEAFVDEYLRSTIAEKYNPLLRYGSSKYYDESTNSYIWKIGIGEDKDVLVKYNDIEDVRIVVYNVDLFGKNPYYVCTLKDLLPKFNIDGRKEAMYDKTKSEYADNDVQSIVFNKNSPCKMVTTQPYSHLNSIDNNHLNGISAIYASFNDEENEIKFEFMLEDQDESEIRNIDNFVPADQLRVLLFNPSYLEAFNRYHLFDIYGVVYVNDLNNPIVDAVGDDWYISYDKQRYRIGPYYIDKNGYKHCLSDVNFNDENALSDSYIIQDTDKLHFKYDEQMIYDITSDMYYYPSINIKYPYSPATYLDSNGKMQDSSGNIFNTIFDESNYYVFRIDDPKDIANSIGNVSIGIESHEPEVVFAMEDYINTGADIKYDYIDPRNLEYIQFFVDAQEYPTFPLTNLTVEIDDDEVKNCEDLTEAINLLHTDEYQIPVDAAGENNYVGKQTFVPQVTFNANNTSVNLADALKVYVNYKKESDQSITLYFNYMNLLDSPFIKIVDGKTAVDIIDGTYLKLNSGEEGQLDLVVQFKYHSKNTVYGVSNVVLATYRIFNLSDDKPKFLVYKQNKIKRNQYEYSDTEKYLQIKVESNRLGINQLEYINGQYYATIIVDIQHDGITLYENNTFSLLYNNNILQYGDCLSQSCTVDALTPGILKIATHENSIKQLAFRFLVKNAESMLKTDSIETELKAEDVQFFYASYDPIQNIRTIDGKILFLKTDDDNDE